MRSPQEVARRAYALALFPHRAGAENGWKEEEAKEREATLRAFGTIRKFMAVKELEDAVSANERTLMGQEVGGGIMSM